MLARPHCHARIVETQGCGSLNLFRTGIQTCTTGC
jgi:hypothetical protein